MAAINYKRLIRLHEERGAAAAKEELKALFEAKTFRPADVDLGRLFVECFGWHNFQECRARRQLANDVFARALTEAEGAVSTAAFQNVSGQFAFQTVLDAYQAEEFVFTPLIPEAQASTLDGEKIPGITEIGDEAAIRIEGDAYTLAGVGEDWVYTPPVRDRGLVVALTWEALFNDKTGRLSERCADVGRWLGVNVEKRAIDCVVDENVTQHRYNWRGTTIASYGDNSGTHTWDNLQATNTLVDWTNLDNVEQLFNQMVDPYTGEPIVIEPKHLIVTKQLLRTAERVLHATEVRVHSGGYATSGNLTQTNAPNPYMNAYEIKTSRLLAARMATDTSWFVGDVGRYAKRMVAERLTVAQAPPNSHEEFHRRIISQWRANEQSAFVVVQPRAIVKSTVA